MPSERLLIDLAVIFVAAKALGGLFERFGQPAVIGELLAGIALGPQALGAIGEHDAYEIFQELGAIFLLFAVGLDTPLSELKASGGRSLAVGAGGIVLPFLAGTGLMLATGETTTTALFVGTAMVATSVGVTARVLADLGRVRDVESRVILGAAIVDDVLGLIVLAVVSGIAVGTFSAASVISVGLLAVGFVVLVGGLGPRLVAIATPALDRLGANGVFTVAVALCLALSALAGALELAAIIGAFLAGMAFAETCDRYGLEERLAPVYSLLVPFFFVLTGALVDLSAFSSRGTAVLAGAVVVVAIVGKLIGCGAAAAGMGLKSAAIVGVGMVPRGEVGILVASIGLGREIIEADLYAIVVLMSVVTTVVVPPVLKSLFGGPSRPPEAKRDRYSAEIEGVGG